MKSASTKRNRKTGRPEWMVQVTKAVIAIEEIAMMTPANDSAATAFLAGVVFGSLGVIFPDYDDEDKNLLLTTGFLEQRFKAIGCEEQLAAVLAYSGEGRFDQKVRSVRGPG